MTETLQRKKKFTKLSKKEAGGDVKHLLSLKHSTPSSEWSSHIEWSHDFIPELSLLICTSE